MNPKLIVIVALLGFSGFQFHQMGCTIYNFRPKASGVDKTPITPSLEPIQKNFSELDRPSVITKKIDGKRVVITPVAYYKITGRVVSKRHYYKDMQAKVSPVDLALAWGELASTQYDSEISYYHSDRYYNYTYKIGKLPFDGEVIAKRSANEHLIPANENISKVIKSIDEDEVVELEGYLVNVDGLMKNGGYFSMDTSTSREDTGAGACEVVYVTKVRIGHNVYQ